MKRTMKRILLVTMTITVIVTSAHVCFGSDPAAIFVQTLLTRRADNVWFVEDDPNEQPVGGYLYRFDLDVDADGEPEVFVSTSLDAGRKGETWAAFRKRGTDWVQLTEGIFLGDEIRLKTENDVRKFSYYIPQKQSEGGSYFGYFWLDKTGMWHDETHPLDESEEATIEGRDPDTLNADGVPDDRKIADKLKLGAPLIIEIKKVLLAKYVQDPNTRWRNVNWDFTLSQQYKDPADAADIASVATWQPPAEPTPR